MPGARQLVTVGIMTENETIDQNVVDAVQEVSRRARTATVELATAGRARKDETLHAIAAALRGSSAAILEANAQDLQRGRENGTSESLLDRLALDLSLIHI